jgi:hypothetical protein
LKHFAAPRFWACYGALPAEVQQLADPKYALLKTDPNHPSLHFKKVGRFRSCRVGLHHRVVGVDAPEGILWFWIGTHAEYDKLVG